MKCGCCEKEGKDQCDCKEWADNAIKFTYYKNPERRRKMNLREKLEEVKNLKQLSSEVEEYIRTSGFVTGSTAWGVDTEDSDIDIIIPPDGILTWDKVIQYHDGIYLHGDEENGIEHYNTFGTMNLYIINKDKIYNLIFPESFEIYHQWVYATKELTEMIEKDPSIKEKIKDKKYRVELFEQLKDS